MVYNCIKFVHNRVSISHFKRRSDYTIKMGNRVPKGGIMKDGPIESTQAMLVALRKVLVQGNSDDTHIEGLAEKVASSLDKLISENNQIIAGSKEQLTNDLMALLTRSEKMDPKTQEAVVNFTRLIVKSLKKHLSKLHEYNKELSNINKITKGINGLERKSLRK